jgi:type II secretory pathway pseudopilin PulG
MNNLAIHTRRQRGWALLETAVAMSLFGLLAVAVVTTVGKTAGQAETAHAAEATGRAENALLGYARQNARLPRPEGSTESKTRPGYVEGWLPADVIDMPGSVRMRYVVEASLIDAPALYQPDPLKLAAGHLAPRGGVTILDLCWKLMELERKGTALPGGMRMGFGVQQATSAESGAPLQLDGIWLGDTASGTPPSGVRLGTRTRGFGELAAALGCVTHLSQLSASIRSTAASMDFVKLANQEVELRQLGLSLSQDSVLNLQWRLINWGIGMQKFVFSLGLEAISSETTPTAWITGPLNEASLALVIAGTAWLLDVTRKNLESGKVGLEKAKVALAQAKTRVTQLEAELHANADLAARLQTSGIDP